MSRTVTPPRQGRPTAEHRVRFQPPLLFATTLLIGIGLQWWVPLALAFPGAAKLPAIAVGFALVAAGVGLAAWAITTLARARTPVNPNLPPTRLVVSGPYRHSRNPIYLAFCLVLPGLGLLLGNGWLVLLTACTVPALNWGVISREEHKLEAHYGADYRSYREKVRRWV